MNNNDFNNKNALASKEELKQFDKDEAIRIQGPNHKPHFMMRIAGGVIDVCLFFLAVFGLSRLFMVTPITSSLKNYENQITMVVDNYKLTPLVEGSEETYSYKLYETEENYSNNTKNKVIYFDEEKQSHYVVVDNQNISEAVQKATDKAFKADKNYKNLSFDYSLVEYGLMMLAGFIAGSILFLLVPLVNKRRATLGKLAAGTMLINSKYETRARWYQIVGRFAFQYLIEWAALYLLISSMLLYFLIVPIVLYIISLFNKKGRAIHDFVSRTMVIDAKTFVPLEEQ